LVEHHCFHYNKRKTKTTTQPRPDPKGGRINNKSLRRDSQQFGEKATVKIKGGCASKTPKTRKILKEQKNQGKKWVEHSNYGAEAKNSCNTKKNNPTYVIERETRKSLTRK